MGDGMLQQGPVGVGGTGLPWWYPREAWVSLELFMGRQTHTRQQRSVLPFHQSPGDVKSIRYKCTDAEVILSKAETGRANREYEGGRKTSKTRQDQNEKGEWRKSGEELTHTETRET